MIDAFWVILALPFLLNAVFLGWVTLGAWLARVWGGPPARPAGEALRIAVLAAAHDEEQVIGGLLASLHVQRYPPERFDVWIVADRCRDGTAAIARRAGARVLAREAGPASKGAALAWLWEQLGGARDRYDAVVLLDADNRADPDLLRGLDARLRAGEAVVQGQRVALNPDATPSAALDGLAEAVHHRVAARGLAFWGWSTTLSGSGVAFRRAIFEELVGATETLVEDCEWQLRLMARGVRIAHAPEALVADEKVHDFQVLARQRARWIQGKLDLARRHLGPFLRRTLTGKPGGLEGLVYLLTLMPRSVLVTGLLAGWGPAVLGLGPVKAGVWATALGLVALHVLSGLVIDGVRMHEVKALVHAPRFARGLWAATARAVARAPLRWERTPHHGP